MLKSQLNNILLIDIRIIFGNEKQTYLYRCNRTGTEEVVADVVFIILTFKAYFVKEVVEIFEKVIISCSLVNMKNNLLFLLTNVGYIYRNFCYILSIY